MKDHWFPRSRREDDTPDITQEQADALAQRASELVEDRIYREVGKTAVRVGLMLAGSVLLGFLAWFGLIEKVSLKLL